MVDESAPDAVRIPAAPAASCENCGTSLSGPFCHRCGQAERSPLGSTRDFLRDAAADLLRLDSRGLRSLALLLGRPGHLSRDYLSGRRVRYTQPLQLYLFCAAAFFLVNAYRPFVLFDPATLQVSSSLSGAAAGLQLQPATLEALSPASSPERFGERFQAAVTGYLPVLLIGSVLLFALLLMAVERHTGRGYLEHAIFALHWTAFYLILMIVDRVAPTAPALRALIDAAVGVLALAYLVTALRRTYDESWRGAVLRGTILFVGFQALIVAWMVSAIGVTYLLL